MRTETSLAPAAPSATGVSLVPAGPILELSDVCVEIGVASRQVRVLDGVSLAVRPGESLGIVGESGSGKSMTAFATIGLLPPRGRVVSGSIRLGGEELTGKSEAQLRRVRGNSIGMVFQDPMLSLNPTMTVFDQVAEPLLLHRRLSSSEIRNRVVETLDLVGIPRARERLSVYPHELSGGLRQRVCIAIALVCEPKLLIADEPTTALDVTIQRQILELIDELRIRFGMAVVLITHDMGVVAGHTDRVAVMYGGRVVETAKTAELFARPRHRYTDGLFASLPERALELGTRLYSIPGQPPDMRAPPSGCSFHPRCEHATERCRTDLPLLGGDDPGHAFACFHPVGDVPEESARATTPATTGSGAQMRPADSTSPDVVVLDNIAKTYVLGRSGMLAGSRRTVSAVAGVSLAIKRGETFGLVGESGCGKSTIARIVAALDKPTSGNVLVDGEDLTRLSRQELHARRRNVHLMFQDPAAAMDPRMVGLDILLEPFIVQQIGTTKTRYEAIARLLRDVGLLPSTAISYPHELSGGQRQRLALARALALRPSLVIADEPVSALDVSVQAQILNLMRDLQEEFHLTFLFVSHNLSVVRYMATTIGVMYLGKLVEVGPANEVYLRPLHPYSRGLIDSEPLVRSDSRERWVIKGELASPISPPRGCRFHPRCPLAKPICAEAEPPLLGAGNGRSVACHFPLAS